MKKMFFVLVVAALSITAAMCNESYKLDDSKVDAMFTNATELSITTDMVANNNFDSSMTMVSNSSNKGKIVAAWVVDWFLGGFGIHRYILGTKANMFVIYTFTVCGIFGIVPLVDWFVLLINGIIQDNGEKYIDNKKFFMW
jgi:TM2 domain-containing membrane protein YozV